MKLLIHFQTSVVQLDIYIYLYIYKLYIYILSTLNHTGDVPTVMNKTPNSRMQNCRIWNELTDILLFYDICLPSLSPTHIRLFVSTLAHSVDVKPGDRQIQSQNITAVIRQHCNVPCVSGSRPTHEIIEPSWGRGGVDSCTYDVFISSPNYGDGWIHCTWGRVSNDAFLTVRPIWKTLKSNTKWNLRRYRAGSVHRSPGCLCHLAYFDALRAGKEGGAVGRAIQTGEGWGVVTIRGHSKTVVTRVVREVPIQRQIQDHGCKREVRVQPK